MAAQRTEVVEVATFRKNHFIEVPGDFGNAVTLVVSVSVAAFSPGPSTDESGRLVARTGVYWALRDSIDGQWWEPLEDTDGKFVGTLGGIYFEGQSVINQQTRRFVVPFGPQLSVYAWLFDWQHPSSREVLDGTVEGLAVKLFWREI